MKYLCLVYLDGAPHESVASSDHHTMTAEVLDFRDMLRDSGYEVVSSSLQPADAATTVRVRNGRVLMEDGPIDETNEHLDGFYLIEAGDLNDAIRIAARMPTARIGSVEIRPIRELVPNSPRQQRLTGQLHP